MTESKSKFTIHRIPAGDVSPTRIQPILDLSNLIFDTARSPPTHHSSIEVWRQRLSPPLPGSGLPAPILVYATATEGFKSESSSSTTNNDPIGHDDHVGSPIGQDQVGSPPIAFVFAIPRTDSDPSIPSPTLHIWLAGVSEQARGTGVFAALMAEVEQHARQDRSEVKVMSVCTYPKRFGKMFAILQRQGWEIRQWLEDGEKVLFVKGLGV
ncbi:hypothetical protein KCU88_g5156, partial [Aureobasidium melanogenum]